MPSLPAHLPRDALDALPELPGVYRFYGLNAHPLYVGKSKNLRERVAALTFSPGAWSTVHVHAEEEPVEVARPVGQREDHPLAHPELPHLAGDLVDDDDVLAGAVALEPGERVVGEAWAQGDRVHGGAGG